MSTPKKRQNLGTEYSNETKEREKMRRKKRPRITPVHAILDESEREREKKKERKKKWRKVVIDCN